MKIFYFSGTGNSLHVAKELGGELLSIPQVLKGNQKFFEDDKIGIICPCYSWSIPSIVEEFLNTITLKADYVFGIITYGAIIAGGTNYLENIGKQNGLQFSYLNKVYMVDNYVEGFDMDKQIKNEHKRNINIQLEKIVSDTSSSTLYKAKTNAVKNKLSKLVNKTYKKSLGKCDSKFYVEDTCTTCKVCEKVCPVGNIIVDNKPVFHHNCIRCYACIHNCPVAAIRRKHERSTARYRNSNVKLQEIIEANN